MGQLPDMHPAKLQTLLLTLGGPVSPMEVEKDNNAIIL
jgi:hypothetical protein